MLCLVGLPPLPLGLGRARGVGVPLGSCLAWAGSLPPLLRLRAVEVWKLPALDRLPFPASPSLWTPPSFSPHVPLRENVRESSGSCSRAVSSRDSRSSVRESRKVTRARSREGSSRGRRRLSRSRSSSRSRSRGRERARRSSSASRSSRGRSRRERSRGLLTAIALGVEALGVEALGRVVIGLDPRIDIGHAVTALDVSGLGLLTVIAPAVSVRVPLPVGGGGAIVRDRTLPQFARLTARGRWSDCLLLLLACVKMEQHDGPDEESRRVWRRLPLSLLWFLEGRRMLLLLQEGHP